MSEVYEEVTAVISSEVITVIKEIGLDVLLTLHEHIHSARPGFYGVNEQYTVTGSFGGITSARQEFHNMLTLLKSYLGQHGSEGGNPIISDIVVNKPMSEDFACKLEEFPSESEEFIPKSEKFATRSEEFPIKSEKFPAKSEKFAAKSKNFASQDCLRFTESKSNVKRIGVSTPGKSQANLYPAHSSDSHAVGQKISFAEFSARNKQTMAKTSKRLKKSNPDILSISLERLKLSGSENSSDGENKLNNDREKNRKKSSINSDTLKPFRYFCQLCSFKTKRSSHLQKHMLVHEKGTTLHKCGVCSFTSLRQSHFRRHMMIHSSELKECSQCNYKTDDGKLLMRHARLKHLKVSRSKCDGHNQTQSKRIYRCEFCCYKTYRKEHYFRHSQSMHASERNFLCHLCGKAFKRADTLQQHHLTHEELRDTSNVFYRCDTCLKTFHSYSNLAEHKAVHTDQRHYLCDMCGASFKTRSVHRKHMVSIHKIPHSYSCKSCSKCFNTSFALKRHLKVHVEVQTNSVVHSKADPTDILAEKLKQVAMGLSEAPATELDSVIYSQETNNNNSCAATQEKLDVSLPQEIVPSTSMPTSQLAPAILQPSKIPTTVVFLTNITPQL